MDWGSAIGGIASAAGSIGDLLTGGYFSRKAWQRQKEAMQNAHQWEVEDLRKAGLNPILSAMGGSGASTGGLNGSMVTDTGAISRGVSNAFQMMQLGNQLDQQRANIDLTKAQTSMAKAGADMNWANARQANESAAGMQINNSYLLKNPDVFDAIQKGKVQSPAGYAAIVEDIIQSFGSSAKSVMEKK